MATWPTFFDMVLVNATETSGHGPFTLGAAVSGFQTAAAAGITNGTPVAYKATDGTNWETAHGVVDVSGSVYTLVRGIDTIKSSNSNSLVSFGNGVIVAITEISEDLNGLVTASAAQSFTATQEAQARSNIGAAPALTIYPFIFAAHTTGNPGSTNWAANNATLSSATTVQFSFTDGLVQNIGDVYSGVMGFSDLVVMITDAISGAVFCFLATAVTVNASWDTLTVTPLYSSGTFTAGDLCYVSYGEMVFPHELTSTSAPPSTSQVIVETSTGVLKSTTLAQFVAAAPHVVLAHGTINGANGNHVAPASTVIKMEGAGGVYTPTVSTILLALYEWDVTIVGGGSGGYVCNYGTGSAPANGAANTGTQVGPVIGASNATAHNLHAGIVGVAVGTAYWFDWGAYNNDGTSSMYVFNPSITLIEL